MKALIAAAAIALGSEAPVPAPPPQPPTPSFPAPKLTGVTPETKCDWGALAAVKPNLLVVTTAAGPLEVGIGTGARFAAADGRPLGSMADLRVGQNVRVYYRVENKIGGGARAQEVDVY
jgi:hypothetical protein